MTLAEEITFGGADFDRSALLRRNDAQISHLLRQPETRVLPIWRNRVPVDGNDRLFMAPADHPVFADAVAPAAFLGIHEGQSLFARDISAWGGDSAAPAGGGAWDSTTHHHPETPDSCIFVDLRQVMFRLSPLGAELAAMSIGLFAWHRHHRFCANCGAASHITMAGWQRECPDCGRQHFPRTDPVVIVLVTSGNDLLLGRSPGWPEGMYSLLAGFMEPGETIEIAARREVFEETRIKLGPVTYLASQPWPFPSSLMIGCRAEATNRTIEIDSQEIEDARWISREEVMADWASPGGAIIAPREGAIASFLIRNWLSGRLS